MAWSANKSFEWFPNKGLDLTALEKALKEGATIKDLYKLRDQAKKLTNIGIDTKVNQFLDYKFGKGGKVSGKNTFGNADLEDSVFKAITKNGSSKLLKAALISKAKNVDGLVVGAEILKQTDKNKSGTWANALDLARNPTNQVKPSTPTITEAQKNKVINVYKNHLGRKPNESDIKKYYDKDVDTLTKILKGSNEYKVKKAYKEVLGREVDPGGLKTWTNFLKTGKTYDQLVSKIKTGKEYLANNPTAVTTATVGLLPKQIEAAYKKLLNRNPSASVKNSLTAKKGDDGKLWDVTKLENWIKGSREYKIKDQFKKSTGKWPTNAQYEKYNKKDGSKFVLSTDAAITAIQKDTKWTKKDTTSTFVTSTKTGTGAIKKFGPANYLAVLKEAKSRGQDLTTIRTNFLHWVDHHGNQSSILGAANLPGKAGGLYEVIKAGTTGVKDGKITGISTYFGDYSKDAKAGEKFSEADYLAARAAGHSDFNIYRYLHSNSTLRGSTTYNTVRNSLITKANTNFSKLVTQDRSRSGFLGLGADQKKVTIQQGLSLENKDRYKHTLENPLWLESAAKIGFLPTNWAKLSYSDLLKNWSGARNTSNTASSIRKYQDKKVGPVKQIGKTVSAGKESGGYLGVLDFLRVGERGFAKYSGSEWQGLQNQTKFDQLHGTGKTTGAGGAGAYTPGKYWQQWGTTGPPNLDIHTEDSAKKFNKGKDKSKHVKAGDLRTDGAYAKGDLRLDQKLAARALLSSSITSDSKLEKALEVLENNFLTKVYTTKGADGKGLWQTAPDTWGLDLMKKVKGKSIGEAQWASDGTLNESWVNSLLYGTTIDWDYYKNDNLYQKAAKTIGVKGGTYKTVDDVRAANVWISAYLQGKDDYEASGTWIRHKPSFTKAGTKYYQDGKEVKLSDQIKEVTIPNTVKFDSFLTPNKQSDIKGQPGDLNIKVDKTYKAKRPTHLKAADFKELKAGAT